jgi:hypothetical protein
MNKIFRGVLRRESPRYEAWRGILGGDDVPVKAPLSAQGYLGGQPADIYELDLDRFSPEQTNRLAEWISRRFSVLPAQVLSELPVQGFPIRAEDVSVAFDPLAAMSAGEFTTAAINLDKERLITQMTEEHKQADGIQLVLNLDIGTALVVIAQIQLALRHPSNTGASAAIARQVIDGMIGQMEDAGLTAFADAARTGDDPRYDVS